MMWKLPILFVTLLFSLVCNAQRTPSITNITPEQFKDIGDTVELACTVQHAQDYPVAWIKMSSGDANVILSVGTALVIYNSRLAVRYDLSSSTYTLQIKDFQEKDAGAYQCQVIFSARNKITADVQLSVRRSPVIFDSSARFHFGQYDGTLTIPEGQPVQMECYANGHPHPTITWHREKNLNFPTGETTYTGSVLKIDSVRKEDRGAYYCVADNGGGEPARHIINLQVEFAPVIVVPRPRLAQALQYDMDLRCHIDAYPKPNIVWMRDNVTLANNQNYNISHFSTDDESTHDSTLRVIAIQKEQYGDYICKAVNKLGEAEQKVHLFENAIPICPPACGKI